MQDQNEIKLLFRNSKNGRLECNMYNKTDAPEYVQAITKGEHRGCYVNLLDNRVMMVSIHIVKYAPVVNDSLQVVAYYNDNCERVEPNTPLYYSDMYDL
jgi:hypothetical protein